MTDFRFIWWLWSVNVVGFKEKHMMKLDAYPNELMNYDSIEYGWWIWHMTQYGLSYFFAVVRSSRVSLLGNCSQWMGSSMEFICIFRIIFVLVFFWLLCWIVVGVIKHWGFLNWVQHITIDLFRLSMRANPSVKKYEYPDVELAPWQMRHSEVDTFGCELKFKICHFHAIEFDRSNAIINSLVICGWRHKKIYKMLAPRLKVDDISNHHHHHHHHSRTTAVMKECQKH